MKIISYINKGNSFPVILENKDGLKQFVKLRAGMSGKYGLVTEWFGNRLAKALGIRTQDPHWITLDKKLEMDGLHIEVQDLVVKSLGTNIGFKYLEEAVPLEASDLSSLSARESAETYLFDLMMLNIDRSPSNTNMMRVGDEVYSIDYESSLLFQELIGGGNLLSDARILKCLRHNPLYYEISIEFVNQFLAKTLTVSLEQLIAEIPSELLSEDERILCLNRLEAKAINQWYIPETLTRLKEVALESPEDYRLRINKNQEDFKRNLKS